MHILTVSPWSARQIQGEGAGVRPPPPTPHRDDLQLSTTTGILYENLFTSPVSYVIP